MPLARYFLFVGGALLALMLAVNAWLPSPVGANPTATEAELGRPVVRIRSDQKLPERIVIDTSIPTIVPAPVTTAAAVEPPVKRSSMDALAQVTPPELTKPELNKSAAKKPEPKVLPKRKVAKRQVHQPMMAYAQAPRYDFDFFSRN